MIEKKRSEFKAGDHVRILKTDKTEISYGINSSMRRMAKSLKSYEIDRCEGSYVRINGYAWDTDDLLNITTCIEEPEENIFNFDVSVLDTGKDDNGQTERIGVSK